ncbi:hypothetical protein [Georgenia sp. Z1491]|uniref:hypothetical protein n=1 Tax=Georgenia sp. Z1491 TaxID=3416707 RepID=UPI003CF3375A
MSQLVLQKAVTPAMAKVYLEKGLDRVSGYVVPAAEVATLGTTEELYKLHGLSFTGTPFAPDQPIDVLHVPLSPTWQMVPATGGRTEAERAKVKGNILDREPFDGSGFSQVGDVRAPLAWIEHDRLTVGARLWRFLPGQAEPEHLGTYHGPAYGWQNHAAGDLFATAVPSKLVGYVAKTDGATWAADVRLDDDGRPSLITLVSPSKDSESQGFTMTEAGTWAKQVVRSEIDELFAMHCTARWNGVPVRVVDDQMDPQGTRRARIFSIARDANVNERHKMDKIDAGVYEKTVLWEELSDVVYAQRVPKQWATEEQLAKGEEYQRSRADGTTTAPAPHTANRSGATLSLGTPEGADESHPAVKHREELQAIVRGMVDVVPADWTRARLVAVMLGTRGEIRAGATTADGTEVTLQGLGKEVAQAVAKLRADSADNGGKGAWLTAVISVEPAGSVKLATDHDIQPTWRKKPAEKDYTVELQRHPRAPENIPDWWREHLTTD